MVLRKLLMEKINRNLITQLICYIEVYQAPAAIAVNFLKFFEQTHTPQKRPQEQIFPDARERMNKKLRKKRASMQKR